MKNWKIICAQMFCNARCKFTDNDNQATLNLQVLQLELHSTWRQNQDPGTFVIHTQNPPLTPETPVNLISSVYQGTLQTQTMTPWIDYRG